MARDCVAACIDRLTEVIADVGDGPSMRERALRAEAQVRALEETVGEALHAAGWPS